MTRDVYIAIMVAAFKGTGLNLSALEVADLSLDEAIHMAALNGLDQKDWPEWPKTGEPKWAKIDPRRKRTPENLTTRPEPQRSHKATATPPKPEGETT